MDYTQMLGNSNELKCITAFILLGFECSIPYGNGAKYDFIADDGERLYRIQCKSSSYVNDHGKIREDAFSFSTVCLTTNTKETIRYQYSSKEIDYFATSFKGKVYVVPVEECKTSKTLRFEPPTNGLLNYNKAEDYLITNIFKPTQKLKESYLKYKDRMLNLVLNKEEKHYYCECGKEVSAKGLRCPECAAKLSRKVERPEREELLKLILTKSFCEIGRMFGVSDNAVKKWCISYNLPSTKYLLEVYNLNPDNFEPFKREVKTYNPDLILKSYNEGYNLKEISEFMGISVDTVRKVLGQLGIEKIRNGNSKIYGQYSLDGKFILKFNSSEDIKKWFISEKGKDIKTGTSHINSCCNGNTSQAYGYIWKYEDRIPMENIK